jgi:hypothetical protein
MTPLGFEGSDGRQNLTESLFGCIAFVPKYLCGNARYRVSGGCARTVPLDGRACEVALALVSLVSVL